MEITKIKTGFLTGNLFQDTDDIDVDASVAKYDAALQAAVENAFPGVEVETGYQDASGVTPASLKTFVWFDVDSSDEAFDYRQEESVIEQVDRIAGDVYENFDAWVVEL